MWNVYNCRRIFAKSSYMHDFIFINPLKLQILRNFILFHFLTRNSHFKRKIIPEMKISATVTPCQQKKLYILKAKTFFSCMRMCAPLLVQKSDVNCTAKVRRGFWLQNSTFYLYFSSHCISWLTVDGRANDGWVIFPV